MNNCKHLLQTFKFSIRNQLRFKRIIIPLLLFSGQWDVTVILFITVCMCVCRSLLISKGLQGLHVCRRDHFLFKCYKLKDFTVLSDDVGCPSWYSPSMAINKLWTMDVLCLQLNIRRMMEGGGVRWAECCTHCLSLTLSEKS